MNIIASLPHRSELACHAARFLDLGQLDAADYLLQAVKALGDVTPETQMTDSRLSLARQDVTQAIKLLDNALLDHPRHAGLRKARAEVR
ncbi:MAG: hypothetical protein INR62_09640, partial [Rhodospirillales bacterium]|nr:hypothetical protein [Acetobacter sp.]